MQEQIELYQTSFTKLLKENIKEKIDIAYIDPPYDTNFVYEAVKIMTEKDMLTENSIIIVETDQEKRIKQEINNLEIEIIDQRKYGRAHLIFLKKGKKS